MDVDVDTSTLNLFDLAFIHWTCLVKSVHGLKRQETKKLAGLYMIPIHASSVSVSSITLLSIWHEAVELGTHVHQHSYQRQCQKFAGNVFTGQEKSEFDFKKKYSNYR